MRKGRLFALIAVACVALAALFLILFWESVLDALPIDQSGWEQVDNAHYYLDEKGDPITGLQQIDGNTYYFDPGTGAMSIGWVSMPGGRSCFGPDGIRLTGWVENDAGRCYIAPNGYTASGWLELPEGTYLLNEAGIPQTGWHSVEDHTYYFREDGILLTGWVEIDGISHYFSSDGTLFSGWLEENGLKRFLEKDGTLAVGWVTLAEGTYYFNEDGTAHTGWLETDDTRYYFDANGLLVTGWITIDGCDYYLLENGSIAQGRQVIDGQTFYFTSTGANILLVNRWNVLPDDYAPETLVSSVDGSQVTPECAEALERMIADCKAAGYYPLVCSSYRTIASQRGLLSAKLEEYSYAEAIQIVAIPGTSEHHTGLAVDIVDANFTTLNYLQAQRPTQQWLMENCWKYGFIVRYPDNTTNYTGIIYEPWHYRYVGTELAAELRELGICLEEYLDNLTGDGESCGGIGK